jgi:hypothetical protein
MILRTSAEKASARSSYFSTPGKGGQLARGAGLSAQLVGTEGDYAQIRLPSGEIRSVIKECLATIGILSNPDRRLIRWGKAGRIRHRGIKPTVKGKNMNPVDHPHGGGEGFHAELKEIDGKKLVIGKDFDPETGKLKSKNKVHLSEKDAADLAESIRAQKFAITSIEQKPFTRNPEAPFTTSTLQQEAARKLRYSAKRTMQVAQKLYENGYITYMRTDSTNLAESAVTEARNLATKLYGEEYISPAPRQFASKMNSACLASLGSAPHPTRKYNHTSFLARVFFRNGLKWVR